MSKRNIDEVAAHLYNEAVRHTDADDETLAALSMAFVFAAKACKLSWLATAQGLMQAWRCTPEPQESDFVSDEVATSDGATNKERN